MNERDRAVVGAAADRLVPGAAEAGVTDYIVTLLTSFDHDPPRIWAGGPFSGRRGGAAGFERWIEPGPWEAHAWRQRIAAWRSAYAALVTALGDDFPAADPRAQDARLAALPAELRTLLYEHACEGMYGDPVYGGNRDGTAWRAIGWPGDSQPRGWTAVEVSGRD